MVDWKVQFEIDKHIHFKNEYDSKLFVTLPFLNREGMIEYKIDGSKNTLIDFKHIQSFKKSMIDNSMSELVYFTFEFQRNCLFLLNDLTLENRQTLLQLIRNSIQDIQPFYKSNSFYCWYDHAVAMRTFFLRDLMIYFSKVDDFVSYQFYIPMYLQHLQFIKSNLHYDFLSNHGLITDLFGLLSIRGFGKESRIGQLNHYFFNRSANRIDHFISGDGIPLEPSTSYWFLIYNLYQLLIKLYKNFTSQNGLSDIELRLTKFENFIQENRIGDQLIRIGQSSGDHYLLKDFPPSPLSKWRNEIICSQYDTGLILLNGYDNNGEIAFQLFINNQQIDPKIHGHEDVGSISLFYQGEFIFETAGSFKFKEQLEGFKNPTLYLNQSLVYLSNSGYLKNVRINEYMCDDRKLVFSFKYFNKKASIERFVSINLDLNIISVTDKKENPSSSEKIISQFLCNPFLNVSRTNDFEVKIQQVNIKSLYSNEILLAEGIVTYSREKINRSKLIQVKSHEKVGIELHLELNQYRKISTSLDNIKESMSIKRNKYRKAKLIKDTHQRFMNAFIKMNRFLDKYFNWNDEKYRTTYK